MNTFIPLTHLRSGQPTYIDAIAVVNVRVNYRNETLVILNNGEGQYVVEPAVDVLNLVSHKRSLVNQKGGV